MRKRFLAIGLATLMVVSNVPLTSYAASTMYTITAESQAAEKTVSYLGIMNTSSLDTMVTRGQFAEMLVNASSYKGRSEWATLTAPFADVASGHWASPYIQVAVNSGWMYGYLGGNFRPDDSITLQEAVYGVTALLGYAKTDFKGSQLSGRMSLYFEKELNKNISKTAGQAITRRDSMNLFYNMLKTNSKAAAATAAAFYGATVFDCTLDTKTGEIDYLALVDNTMVGPILVEGPLDSILPFAFNEGKYYIDDEASRGAQIHEGNIIYYNKSMKTVWAYTERTATYEIDGTTKVHYGNGGVTPTSVTIEKQTYLLKNSAVAYEFSALGDAMKDGQTITVIYEIQSNGLEQDTYVITGVIIGK